MSRYFVTISCEYSVADTLAAKGEVYPEIVANCSGNAVFGTCSSELSLIAIQELLPVPWQ